MENKKPAPKLVISKETIKKLNEGLTEDQLKVAVGGVFRTCPDTFPGTLGRFC